MDKLRPPKICRTCLKRTHQTFGSQQSIDDTGNLKISLALRYLLPELYLGLSTNPEICQDCKDSLKSAYNFKKTCLHTENVIGTFLKKSRCTGQSVDLHDVLLYLETENLNTEDNSVKATIISEWEDDSSEELHVEQNRQKQNENEETSVKTPEKIDIEKNNLSFCEETGLFVNEDGAFFNAHGTKIDESQIQKEKENLEKKINSIFEISNINTVTNVQNNRNPLISLTPKEKLFPNPNLSQFMLFVPKKSPNLSKSAQLVRQHIKSSKCKQLTQTVDNLVTQETASKSIPIIPMKGRRIYYLNESPQNTLSALVPMLPNYKILKSKYYQKQKRDTKIKKSLLTSKKYLSLTGELRTPSLKQVKPLPDLVNFKTVSEPLKMVQKQIDTQSLNIKEEPVDLYCKENMLPQDEDTLTAPESVAYENNLQDIINNLDHDDTNQYVDVPEFVTINKFSIKDLQELKNKTSAMATSQKNPENVSPQGNAVEKADNKSTELKPENHSSKIHKSLSKLLPTKPLKHIKTKGKNTVTASCVDLKGLLDEAKSTNPIPKESKNMTVPKTRGRRGRLSSKRKLKIVPVTETAVKSAQVDDFAIIDSPVVKTQDNEECYKNVLDICPKLTMDGSYINDHDYLHNLYRRQNILMCKSNGWSCMCFICGSCPIISKHLSHMYQHGSQCKVCFLDLGTPFSLNFHVRRHFKYCVKCQLQVAYGDIEKHERWHGGNKRSVLKDIWNDTGHKSEGKIELDENSSDSDNIQLSKLVKTHPRILVKEKMETEQKAGKRSTIKRVRNPCCNEEDAIGSSKKVLRSKIKKARKTKTITKAITETKDGTS